jgi:hypothetical protein
MIVNEHFANIGRNKALLVPALILRSKLHGTTIPMDAWHAGVRAAPQDIAASDFTVAGMIAASKRYGSPVLDLGTPSVYSGGLCNAFPPKSAPYWSWEANRSFSGTPFKDMHGHIHKTMATGNWSQTMTPALEEVFAKFKHGHLDVFETAHTYLTINNLFRLAHSLWNKGLTASADATEWEAPDWQSPRKGTVQSEQFIAEQSANGQRPGADDSPAIFPHSFRMLQRAQSIHDDLQRQGIENPNQYPILTTAPTFQYAAAPRRGISLPTATMVLTVAGHAPFALLEMPEEHRQAVWQQYVMPLFRDMMVDFRFVETEI